jgi:hypothetical protein
VAGRDFESCRAGLFTAPAAEPPVDCGKYWGIRDYVCGESPRISVPGFAGRERVSV